MYMKLKNSRLYRVHNALALPQARFNGETAHKQSSHLHVGTARKDESVDGNLTPPDKGEAI